MADTDGADVRAAVFYKERTQTETQEGEERCYQIIR